MDSPLIKCRCAQVCGRKTGLNKAAAPITSENSPPLDFSLLYFQTAVPAIVRDKLYLHQDAQARNELDITNTLEINIKDLYTLLAIVQCVPRMRKRPFKGITGATFLRHYRALRS
jgi:hypothetical protein